MYMQLEKIKNSHAMDNIEFIMLVNRFNNMKKREKNGYDIYNIRIAQDFVHLLIKKSKAQEFDAIEKNAFNNLAIEVSDWIKTITPKEFKEMI